MVKTYILAGDDPRETLETGQFWFGSDGAKGAFETEVKFWQEREAAKGDVVVLFPTPGQAIADLARQIETPANIIICAHGGKNGTFVWDKDHSYSYSDLFGGLPDKGVESITIGGCYGGSALLMLESVSAGTILQSRVGAKVFSWSDNGTEMTESLISCAKITPQAILLKALCYKNMYTNALRSELHGRKSSSNDELPHLIGIGGRPPVTVDLNREMAALSAGELDHEQFQRVIAQVREHFDVDSSLPTKDFLDAQKERLSAEVARLHIERRDPEEDRLGWEKFKQDREKYALDDEKYRRDRERYIFSQTIMKVSQRLEAGTDVGEFTLEERRIGYAITVASLYETGRIGELVATAKRAERASAAHATAVQKHSTGLPRGPRGPGL